MLKRNHEEQSRMDIPEGCPQKAFIYEWRDRSNERICYVEVLEDGQLLSYRCWDKDNNLLYERRFIEFDSDKKLWFLPTPKQPFFLNIGSTKCYNLGTSKIDPEKNEKCVLEEEEEKSKRDKTIWYDFHDEHNKRNYEVGFHIDGDMVGYCTSESTKNDPLYQIVPSSGCEHYEEYKIDGKCVLVGKG